MPVFNFYGPLLVSTTGFYTPPEAITVTLLAARVVLPTTSGGIVFELLDDAVTVATITLAATADFATQSVSVAIAALSGVQARISSPGVGGADATLTLGVG